MLNRRIHALTRAELYEMVWAEPVIKIAQRYGISGNGLAKICRKAAIPLPPRGYWAKLQHGKKPRRPPLKPAGAGATETVKIIEGTGPRPATATHPDLEPGIASALAAAGRPENRIVVPAEVARLHPEVAAMAKAIDVSWTGKRTAPEPLERRRRRLLHAFFRAVEAIRGSVVSRKHNVGFEVTVFGSTFVMTCSEPERRVRVNLTPKELCERPSWDTRDWRTESRATGVLRMRVHRERDKYKDFVETDKQPLESRLNDVLTYLLRNSITVGERLRREEAAGIAQAEAERRRLDEARQRYEIEEERRRESERIDALVEETARWRRATHIRAYVAAAGARMDSARMTWALGVADGLDPLKRTF